jgi:hypothetical protein
MRGVLEILMVVTGVATVALVLLFSESPPTDNPVHEQVAVSLDAMQQEVQLRRALQTRAEDRRPKFPQTLRTQWFAARPSHPLLDGDARPWLDVAPEGVRDAHPPDPVASSSGQAAFWYNPATGVVRARVPAGPDAAATLALYNRINSTNLTRLPMVEDDHALPLAQPVTDSAVVDAVSRSGASTAPSEPHSQPRRRTLHDHATP